MILLDEDLGKYLGSTYIEIIKKMRENSMLYEGLNQKRGELFKKTYSDINEYVEKAEKVHK